MTARRWQNLDGEWGLFGEGESRSCATVVRELDGWVWRTFDAKGKLLDKCGLRGLPTAAEAMAAADASLAEMAGEGT